MAANEWAGLWVAANEWCCLWSGGKEMGCGEEGGEGGRRRGAVGMLEEVKRSKPYVGAHVAS